MQEKSSFDSARYQELADKWVQGTLSPAERKELEDWYNAGQDLPVLLPPGFAAEDTDEPFRLEWAPAARWRLR